MSAGPFVSTARRADRAVVRVALDVVCGVAVGGAALATIAFAVVALRRMGHPFELEWIEGGSLDQVARFMHGRPLYTRPSVAWAPNIYPPLYYWVAATVAHASGLNFATLRAVSFVSTLGLGASVWLLVRRETREWIGPTVATGLLFATYHAGGAWFDIARVDMLFLALLFAGLYLARTAASRTVAIASATVMVLALLAKQSALLPALAVIPAIWMRGRQLALAYASAFVGEAAMVLGLLQITTHGWFAYYVWTVPSHHRVEHSAIFGFWTHDLSRALAPALVVAVVALVVLARRAPRSTFVFHLAVFTALVLTSYAARLHTGGWDNVLLPVYAGVAMLAGIAVGRAREAGSSSAAIVVTALVIAQFGMLVYSPASLVPSQGSSAAGHAVVAQLRALRGPVLLTGQPWMLARAGHADEVTAHASAIEDVLRSGPSTQARALEAELETNLRQHRYCSVVVDRPAVYSALPSDFGRYYVHASDLRDADGIEPVTGYAIVAAEVWVPRGAPACG